MHRPEDIIPEYAQPLLKGQKTEKVKTEQHSRLFGCAAAETDREAGKVTVCWWLRPASVSSQAQKTVGS